MSAKLTLGADKVVIWKILYLTMVHNRCFSSQNMDPVCRDNVRLIDGWIGGSERGEYATHHDDSAEKVRNETDHGQRAAPSKIHFLKLHEDQH